jgi:hypothetical protein
LNSENKNVKDLYRGINDFQRGYQSRNCLVKDENSDLQTDFHNIINRWKSYFSQLLNVYNASDVWQFEIFTAEPLAPDSSHLEVEIAIAELKTIKLQVVIKFRQNWLKQEVKH